MTQKSSSFLVGEIADAGNNSTDLCLQLCPGCSCAIPSQSTICDYCLAVLSLGSDGRWVVDGRICAACGAESTLALAPCPRCRTPRGQSCPSCGLETMSLKASRCPSCQTPREAFFDICVREAARRRQEIDAERRSRPLIMFLVCAITASLTVALGYLKGYFDSPKGALFILLTTSIFLSIGLLPMLKK